MGDAEALMHANLLEVFNERDPVRRAAAIARTYADDVVFADPESVVTGGAALDAKAQGILDGAPGFVFAASGPVYLVQDLAYLAWGFGPAGQPPVVTGVDIGFVAHGKLARLYTLLQ
jgi:hypothetical protein